MGTAQERQALSRLLHENVLHIVRSSGVFGGHFELDAIICITGVRENQEVVARIHERFGNGPFPPPKSLSKRDLFADSAGRMMTSHARPGGGYPMVSAAHGMLMPTPRAHAPPSYMNEAEPEMLDLRINQGRNNNENNSNKNLPLKPAAATSSSRSSSISSSVFSSHAKRWRQESQQSFESRASEQDLDKSYSSATSPSLEEQAENLSVSATNSDEAAGNTSPDKAGQYLGKSPYLPSPFHLHKKSQLKQERWTPSTPLPTVPECRQCGFTFETFDVLSDHNEAVHSVFTCQHCHKTFTSRSNLERHSRLHTGFKPYECAICGKRFSRKDHLSNHSAKHAYKCGNCNKRYADKQSLGQHFSLEHDAMLTNTCEFCNKGFSSLEACEEHVKTHSQYQAVQRAYQSKPPPDTPQPQQQQQQQQQQQPTSPLKQRHVCDVCKFSALDRITLMKHRLVHLVPPRSYSCAACAKMFNDPLQLDEHMRSHEGQQLNVFECLLCRQVFPTLDILRRHEVIHCSEDEAMSSGWPCPHCQKTLKSLPSLQEHILQHAAAAQTMATSKKHTCLFCNMAFNSYHELCRHMDELRHYPPDPRMLFHHLGMPQPFGGAFNGRKLADLFAFREQHNNLPQPPQNGLTASSPAYDRPVETESKPEAAENSGADNDAHTEAAAGRDDNEQRQEVVEQESADASDDKPDEALENDIGSDIEVVEPEAPEEDMPTNQNQADSFKEELEAERRGSDADSPMTPNESRDGGAESPTIQNQPVKTMLANKNSNNSAAVEQRIKEEVTTPVSDVTHVTTSEPSASTTVHDEDSVTVQAVELSREAAKRARKRKWPSPEKYVNIGEPVDMSLNELYNNCELENSVAASENSSVASSSTNGFDLFPPTNPFTTVPNLFPRVSPTLTAASAAAAASTYEVKPSERRREVSRITPTKMSVDIPPGPCRCSICHQTVDSFQSLEQHCFAEHSRCPCMFCPKTFAQKANRDRHVCLHTGDRPYECPECGERFSRGDKLKLHRTRTHNIPTNPSGKRDDLPPPPPPSGRNWIIPSPSTNHSLDHDPWGLMTARDDTNAMLSGGGEWMLPQAMTFPGAVNL